jgi:hypothetical protein
MTKDINATRPSMGEAAVKATVKPLECASDGCGKPATQYFERGGVGSHHCHDCYTAILSALDVPAQAEGVKGARAITATDILREWFGGDRYARDYEYLDANYGPQATRVATYVAKTALSHPEPVAEEAVTRMSIAEAAKALEHVELPDDLRLPLHSLQADLGWLFGRVADDGSMASMCEDSARSRLSQIESACYRIAFVHPAPLPEQGDADDLVRRLRRQVDIQIEDNLVYIQAADALMDEAATAISTLRAKAAELEKERERLAAIVEERFKDTRLVSAGGRGEGFGFDLTGGPIPYIAEYLAQFMGHREDRPTANYSEIEVQHNELGPLTLTMQRRSGKTPHQLRVEADARAESADAKNADLQLRIDRAREVIKPFAAFADEADALGHSDDSTCVWRIKAADLRTARDFMENGNG